MTADGGGTDQIELWDVGKWVESDQSQELKKPLLELWAPYRSGKMQLSVSGLLSLEAGGGDVHVSASAVRSL